MKRHKEIEEVALDLYGASSSKKSEWIEEYKAHLNGEYNTVWDDEGFADWTEEEKKECLNIILELYRQGSIDRIKDTVRKNKESQQTQKEMLERAINTLIRNISFKLYKYIAQLEINQEALDESLERGLAKEAYLKENKISCDCYAYLRVKHDPIKMAATIYVDFAIWHLGAEDYCPCMPNGFKCQIDTSEIQPIVDTITFNNGDTETVVLQCLILAMGNIEVDFRDVLEQEFRGCGFKGVKIGRWTNLEYIAQGARSPDDRLSLKISFDNPAVSGFDRFKNLFR